MKKLIIVGIGIIACVALCAAMWLRNAEVGDLPAKPIKNAVIGEMKAQSDVKPHIIFSGDTDTPEQEAVSESEPPKTNITAEKETKSVPSVTPKPPTIPAQLSAKPQSGDRAIIDGEPHIWIPGFGWVKGESGRSIGTFAADMYENGNKIGIMGGGTTVGNPGDELTGNKVGIMGGEEPSRESTPPPLARPEPTGDVIYIELQPTPTKDSTPPPYKQNATNP